MKYLTLIYLVTVFHIPVWSAAKNRFYDDMPKWMRKAIRVRNEYERKNGLLDCFYWAKVGRLYVRKYHSLPIRSVFAYSPRHLFVWKRATDTTEAD